MFKSSVVSYPSRGSYGNNRYRGNCTGHIIKDFVESYADKDKPLLVDPSIGGGTSQDVAKSMNIPFVGTDLSQGFNLLRDDLSTFVGAQADLVWWHPPYWNMIAYSGNQWGEANRWDMSRMSLPMFVEALELALMNIHDACKKGGHYGVLMGNLRRQNKYYNLSSLVERVAPGCLVDEVIKVQHNCLSNNRHYHGSLVRIAHEKLLVFKRNNDHLSVFMLGLVLKRASCMIKTTWKAVLRRILQGKETMSLGDIYQAIKPYASQRNNQHWQAKVRQELRRHTDVFVCVGRGHYALTE